MPQIICNSTRCRFNENGTCNRETITISKGGDCKNEDWGDDFDRVGEVVG